MYEAAFAWHVPILAPFATTLRLGDTDGPDSLLSVHLFKLNSYVVGRPS